MQLYCISSVRINDNQECKWIVLYFLAGFVFWNQDNLDQRKEERGAGMDAARSVRGFVDVIQAHGPSQATWKTLTIQYVFGLKDTIQWKCFCTWMLEELNEGKDVYLLLFNPVHPSSSPGTSKIKTTALLQRATNISYKGRAPLLRICHVTALLSVENKPVHTLTKRFEPAFFGSLDSLVFKITVFKIPRWQMFC